MKPKRLLIPIFPAAAVCVISMMSAASAADVTLTGSDALNTTSFNAIGLWDSLAAPASGNDYFTSGFTLRTPNTTGQTYTFEGDSLTVDFTGRLLGKSTGTQTLNFTNGDGLILNGGAFYQANASTTAYALTATGKIRVDSPSYIGASGALGGTANSETLDITAVISGAGDLTV
ncbi:MAG: hypothetical protein EOP85_11110, partial [Verrucomicrobiaceae bacterium]